MVFDDSSVQEEIDAFMATLAKPTAGVKACMWYSRIETPVCLAGGGAEVDASESFQVPLPDGTYVWLPRMPLLPCAID